MLVERNAAMVSQDGDLLPAGGRPPPGAADGDSGRRSSGGDKARRLGDHRFLDRSGDRRIGDHSENRFEEHSWVVGVVTVAVEAGSSGETTRGAKGVTHEFGFDLRGCWAIGTVRRQRAEGEGRGVQNTAGIRHRT